MVFRNTRAFDRLVGKYQSSVLRFFLHLTCGDSEVSDDLAQDTFIKAYTLSLIHISGIRQEFVYLESLHGTFITCATGLRAPLFLDLVNCVFLLIVQNLIHKVKLLESFPLQDIHLNNSPLKSQKDSQTTFCKCQQLKYYKLSY